MNNQTGANCSNGGDGTQSQPYCTISAAAAVVNPGQTVHVSGSSYPEHLTIDRSGIPDQPIIFAAVSTAPVMLTGTDPGISIDGQHDVSAYGFGVGGRQTGPAVSIRNSTRLKLDHTHVSYSTSGATSA